MLKGSVHVATARRRPSMNSACAAREIGGRRRGGERVSRRRSGLLLRALRARILLARPRPHGGQSAGLGGLSSGSLPRLARGAGANYQRSAVGDP